MTSFVDKSIEALRSTHDELAGVVNDLSDDQLTAKSAASEWSVAQVLSHLGSGAEISLATLRSAVDATPAPDQGFNENVWARWNALSAREQAAGFLAADEELVVALEALTAAEREALQVKLAFLPTPMPLAGYAGMRLNEAALHSWDVRVSLDPAAVIADDIADVLAEHLSTDLSFLLGFTSKADALASPAVVELRGTPFVLAITDTVSLAQAAAVPPTATFSGPLEAALRLVAGRLTAAYTPDGVDVTGNVSLDDLRRVFPGF
ncbi:maleylpyruvate isomerase family mycothiol-dependent enzyme [Jatrophihabitans sp. DSM 45814]